MFLTSKCIERNLKKLQSPINNNTTIAEELSSPLCWAINRCLHEGIFPNELKLAKVVPIHKKDDKNKECNYRPISILPVFSKVFETVIKNRLVNYFERFDVFSSSQHGYRKGKSTVTAVTAVVESILEAMDEREYTELVAYDLSKAFDCVNHEVLLQKLWHYGIRGTPHDLLRSYLQGRKQAVWWQNGISTKRDVTIGVPQGSILGPLLFIIYVNDLPQNINSEVFIYADDTSLLMKGAKNEIVSARQTVLESVETWFAVNKLKINNDKNQSLTFSTTKGEEKEVINLLGLKVDSGLGWSEHIQSLCGTLSRALYAIRKIKNVSTHNATRCAYYANFHSVATYGISVWGASSELERVLVLQKSAVRILCGLGYRDSCREFFKREGILTVVSVYILSVVRLVHQSSPKLTRGVDLHNYNTRQKEKFVIPKHRLKLTQQSANFNGLKFYNHLPNSLKQLSDKKFKTAVKKILLKTTIYNISEYFGISHVDQ